MSSTARNRMAVAWACLLINLPVQAGGESQAAPVRQNQAASRGDRLAGFRACGIDKAQEAKLMSLTEAFENNLLPKTHTLLALMHEMQALARQADPKPEIVLSKQEEINKLNGELTMQRLKYALAMRNVLTAQQKQKYVQLMQTNSQRHVLPGAYTKPAGH